VHNIDQDSFLVFSTTTSGEQVSQEQQQLQRLHDDEEPDDDDEADLKKNWVWRTGMGYGVQVWSTNMEYKYGV
jgi:hypothetical protein